MDAARAVLPFISHYAQKYVMEKYANKPVLDDGGYEDQLFIALNDLCRALGEPLLDRAELTELAKEPNRLMWSK
jgi:hypothetical protein